MSEGVTNAWRVTALPAKFSGAGTVGHEISTLNADTGHSGSGVGSGNTSSQVVRETFSLLTNSQLSFL